MKREQLRRHPDLDGTGSNRKAREMRLEYDIVRDQADIGLEASIYIPHGN